MDYQFGLPLDHLLGEPLMFLYLTDVRSHEELDVWSVLQNLLQQAFVTIIRFYSFLPNVIVSEANFHTIWKCYLQISIPFFTFQIFWLMMELGL